VGKSKKGARKNKQTAIEYEPCIVTFVDVLGFRELVNTRTAADVHRVIAALERFTRPDRSELSKEDLGLISQAHARSVSDAIVRIRPYKTLYQDGALFHEIIDLLHAQIELVNLGVLVRAGLTVGNAYVGAKLNEPVFGPAMVRAYDIESKEAIFPRIVIDDDALNQHRLDKYLRSDNNSLADEIKLFDRLLARGEDGTRYIDYLGAAGEFDDPAGHLQFLQTHATLIRTGRTENKNRAVLRKFEWLAVYHNKQVEGMRQAVLSTKKSAKAFFEEYEVKAKTFFEEILV
jgi:hypothetical protein